MPEDAWNYFYRELKDRYGFDAKIRRKNNGLKFALDAVEQEPGMLENLHKIVSAGFRNLDLPKPRLVNANDMSPVSYDDCVQISPSEGRPGDFYNGKNWYRLKEKATT